MEHVPGSVVPPKVVNPSMLVTWWTAQIQNAPAAHIARLEFLVSCTEATSPPNSDSKPPRGAGFQPAIKKVQRHSYKEPTRGGQ